MGCPQPGHFASFPLVGLAWWWVQPLVIRGFFLGLALAWVLWSAGFFLFGFLGESAFSSRVISSSVMCSGSSGSDPSNSCSNSCSDSSSGSGSGSSSSGSSNSDSVTKRRLWVWRGRLCQSFFHALLFLLGQLEAALGLG